MSVELTGELRCSRIRRLRRGNNVIAMLLDIGDPLPPWETWTLVVPDETSRHRNEAGPVRFYKTKSGQRPKALADVPEGASVTVRCTVTDWGNGLGGYLSHVKLVSSPSD